MRILLSPFQGWRGGVAGFPGASPRALPRSAFQAGFMRERMGRSRSAFQAGFMEKE
jgi:hypothetical protein